MKRLLIQFGMILQMQIVLQIGVIAAQAAGVTLVGSIRDFCAPDIPATCTRLADFEGTVTGVVTGMVSSTLNAAGLPDYVGGGIGATNAANFAKWYTDAPGFNLAAPFSLTLSETAPGSGVVTFSSASFFPLDGTLFGNQGRSHNYHFTLRLKGLISFKASDTFTFAGDDDLWIYIGGRLAIDLGGVHGAASKTISGTNLIALGLSEDTLYDLDVFFAERHTVSSTFEITTNFQLSEPVADLAITKTDGVSPVVSGTTATYTIVVSNNGPSAVTGAPVTDTLPAALTGATWTCVGSAGSACGAASGSGSIATTVDLLVGGTATYTLTATIAPSATGMLNNTASVAPPGGVTDLTPGNNVASASATLTPQADLAITKNGGTSVVPGTPTTYTIVVSNNGPSAVTGAFVTDTLPAALTGATWTCAASTGSACATASGSGDIAMTVDLLVGGAATFTLTATIAPSATGTLVNTASVAAPGGVADLNPGNNVASASATLAPQADLTITKTNGGTTAVPGTTTTYTIVVRNNGPSAVTGTLVTDTLPGALMDATWTCAASAGSACATAGGSGDITMTVDLLVGGTATFTLTATIAPSATGTLINTASVAAPGGVTDPTTSNNSGSDTVTLTPNPAIPTLSRWGMLLLAMLLVGVACSMLRRRTLRL